MAVRRFLLAFAATLALGGSALLGAAAGGAAVFAAVRSSLPAAAPAPVAGPDVVPAEARVYNVDINTAIEDAVAQLSPAVVTVVSTVRGGQASGSGVIISEDGHIITNNHVVEGAQAVEVIFADGTTVPATLVGTDAFADIAVLQVDGAMPGVARLGNSDALNPGETVIAIGSPLGDFRNTVTVGVVSGVGRSIPEQTGLFQLEGLIQTDAAINHGNSGGPLANLAGEVVGINTLVVRGTGSTPDQAEGLGFAVPSSTVQAISQQLIEHGYVIRPYLGINWEPITPDVARVNRLPVEWGVYVTAIAPGSPAEAAGIEVGDLITAVSGVELDAKRAFINTLWTHNVGEAVELTVWRDGQQTLTATLAERPRS